MPIYMPVLSSDFFTSHWAHHFLYILVNYQQLVFSSVSVLSLSPVLTSLVLSHIFAPSVHTSLLYQGEIQIIPFLSVIYIPRLVIWLSQQDNT